MKEQVGPSEDRAVADVTAATAGRGTADTITACLDRARAGGNRATGRRIAQRRGGFAIKTILDDQARRRDLRESTAAPCTSTSGGPSPTRS